MIFEIITNVFVISEKIDVASVIFYKDSHKIRLLDNLKDLELFFNVFKNVRNIIF